MNSPRTLRLARIFLSAQGAPKSKMRLTSNYSRVSSRSRIALEQDYADDAMSKFGTALPFNSLFPKKATRVVIPYENDAKRKISQALGKTGELGENGYDSVDWVNGEAIKTMPPNPKAPPGSPPKQQRIKLGKAIGRLSNGKQLLDWWSTNKEAVQKDDYSIVISRHPVDVMRMSDHDQIESCHSPNAGEWDSCVSEVKHGGLVSYLVPNDELRELSPEQIAGRGEIFYDEDRNVEGAIPLSRLRVRRFTNEDEGFDLALPETKLYGRQNTAFKVQVMDWARKSQAPIINRKRWRMSEFTRRGGQYSDTNDGKLFNELYGDHEESEYSSTEFGIAGKEDVDMSGRRREEIEAIHERWQREFKHCSTSYDEYGDDEEDGVSFYWSGSIGIDFPENLFVPETLDEVEGHVNKGYGQRRNKDSLYDYLTNNNIYPSDNEIYFSRYNGKVQFGIDIDDSDRQDNGPDGYNDFCDTVFDDWDQKFDEIKGVITKWLLDHEFMNPTPVRQFEQSDVEFQNFDVSIGEGEMEASAEDSIGAYDPELWSEAFFKSHVEAQIRGQVSKELARIIQMRKNPSGYLPGFEPEVPANIKEEYNLNNFKLYMRMRGNPHQIMLKLIFAADDLTTQEDMQEVIELMTVVDRIFPRIIAEGSRLLESYYNQMRQYVRGRPGGTMDYSGGSESFEFNPNM